LLDTARSGAGAGSAPAGKGLKMSIGRTSSSAAEQVSRELRTESSAALRQRRLVVALSLVAGGSMGLITLYQMGIIDHLPEPPVGTLDADRVDASGEAYELFKAPDAALGLVSYAVTLALAAAGGADRAQAQPLLPLALAAKVALDAAGAIVLTVEQGSKHRKYCSWCLLAATASLAMLPAVVPESRRAWRMLRGTS
jgi:uncharacterized membrane protein